MANNIFKTFQSIGDQTRALLAGQKPKTNAQAALDRYTSQPVQTNSPWYESDPGFIEDHKNYTGHDNVVEKEKIEKINKPYTGGADNPDEALNYLKSMYTTPEQEEKYRKASVANQRIMAVADALRHIGNIYHTTKGAPAQKFNSPVLEEYGRYRQEKALRDAANYKYLSYKQAKQRQDAAMAKMEREYELKAQNQARQQALADAQVQKWRDELANKKEYNTGLLALREKLGTAQQKERERHNKVAENQGRQRIGIASRNSSNAERHRQWIRANKSNGGGTGTGRGSSGVAPLDTPKGKIYPSGKSYSNQLLQMYDYAKKKGLVAESDIAKTLREAGLGSDQKDNVKRQTVLDLLRTNKDLGDYANKRLGWTYGGGEPSSDWSQYEEEEEDWNDYLED